MEIINVHEAKTHLSRLLQRVEAGEEIVKTPDDFYNPLFCGDESCASRCDDSHRACYPMCGGKVESYTYCAANCE